MKLVFKIQALLILLMVMFSSCEKVIDLDLNKAEPKIVIYSDLTDQPEGQVVRISKTYDFSEPNRFNAVSGAVVTVTTPSGIKIPFPESTTPGVYQSGRFRGRVGSTYTLTVDVEGKQYTASSTMQPKVLLDSLTFRELSFFGKTSSHVVANFQDPAGVRNYYRYILKVKSKIVEDVVSEDRFNDGNRVANTIFHELDDLDTGDPLELELQCIDPNVYRYYFSLKQNVGGGGPPVAPENPPSNISNGALGVFSAHTSSKRAAKVL